MNIHVHILAVSVRFLGHTVGVYLETRRNCQIVFQSDSITFHPLKPCMKVCCPSSSPDAIVVLALIILIGV
jgi:hypothetical protein